jgi:hypothetical protein
MSETLQNFVHGWNPHKKNKYLFLSLLDENVSFFVSQKFQNEWNSMLQNFGKIQKT